MFTLHRSNLTEALVDALAEVVGRRLDDPFAAEHIVVQGKGMERWLSMQLARRLGVWANPQFPFPRKIVEMALAALPGDAAEPPPLPYEPETMLWAIAALLDELRGRPELVSIDTYLRDDRNDIKKLQLAERIADTFDHYTVYRPQMVLEWEAGEGDDWQALLWRELMARHAPQHLAGRFDAFRRAAGTSAPLPDSFPTRLSFFGMSTLPPLYLELLRTLAPRVDIHLFVLSPSREYWGDIRSRRDRAREAAHYPAAAALPASLGNPLLASLGRLGRDFLNVLLDTVNFDRENEPFVEPTHHSALGSLQSDIFHLVHRTNRSAAELGFESADPCAEPLVLDPADDSIRIHACHGPMREVEVLRDQLLALFDRDPGLHPHDVIVMTPSIDAYAPYIEAAFSVRRAPAATPDNDPQARPPDPAIPFRIADRGARATNETFEALGSVIDALRGRLTAPEVLDLLGIELLRERFAIDAADVDLIRGWVLESGIRWGVDGADRIAAGLPGFEENSWRFGLERLFLGYAMEGCAHRMFEGALPYDDIEGKAAAALGKLASLCEALFEFRSRLGRTHTPAAWSEHLAALLAATLAVTRTSAPQHLEIAAALQTIAERATRMGFTAEIDLVSLRSLLEAELTRLGSARGFLGGGVTFCELIPMRTIPFRVVCLLGLNDGSFPRTRRPLGFDLIAQQPQPGDRSQREDDRYLFLEALLSAREHLIVTYTGRSIRDNGELPPSVVVSEFLDALEESFVATENVKDLVVVHHPLQAFSPRYFDPDGDPRLFSYSTGCAAGARSLADAGGAPRPFVGATLPAAEVPREVSLDSLLQFFRNPVRQFCTQRLELRLEDADGVAPEREPLDPTQLEQWKIGDELMRSAEGGCVPAEMLDVLRAAGSLPPGSIGSTTFAAIESSAAPIAAAAASRRAHPIEPLPFAIDIDGVRISGTLCHLTGAGPVEMQYSRLEGYHELGVWIRHLVWQLVAPAGCGRDSVLVGRNADGAAAMRLRAVEDAGGHLAVLLRLYRRGLEAPLPFFRYASRAYAATFDKPKVGKRPDARDSAVKEARKKFAGGFTHGDWSDPHLRLVYNNFRSAEQAFDNLIQHGPDDPESFEALARCVWDPMLRHRDKVDT